MKILFILLFVLTASFDLKAQDATIGKSKDQIRALIKPNSGINLLQGSDCDTLTMQGGLAIFMYYKNNICYASKSIMPLSYMNMVTEKMTTDSYKKLTEDTWINNSQTVKVKITVLKDKNQFIVDASSANKE